MYIIFVGILVLGSIIYFQRASFTKSLFKKYQTDQIIYIEEGYEITEKIKAYPQAVIIKTNPLAVKIKKEEVTQMMLKTGIQKLPFIAYLEDDEVRGKYLG